MRTLRTDNLKLTDDLSRLKEKQTEAQRKLDIAEGSEASLKTQLKTAEATIRALKEDMARHRTLVAQARTSCATEVRRRDRQIDTLKKQLSEAGRSRGSRGNPGVTTITVTGDFGAEKPDTRASTADAGEYNLRSETNAFLAELARNLSEENEAITASMRQTIEKLRQMSGWTNEDDSNSNADPRVVKHLGWDDMASDLNSVLDHMKVILTNPSFVPIEEVEIREEEIARLKSGWVKMEDRWKEAVHLIDGWRKRMAASGRPIDDEELKMGLRLSPVRVKNVRETRQAQLFDLSAVAEEEEVEEEEMMEDEEEQREGARPDMDGQDEDEEMMNSGQVSPCPVREESLELVPAPEMAAQDNTSGHYDENGFYEDNDEDEDNWKKEGETDAEEEPNVEVLRESTGSHAWDRSQESSPLPEPPQLSPLRQSPSAANRRPQNNIKKPKPSVPTNIAKENSWDHATHDDKPPQPPPHRTKPVKSAARSLARPPRQIERSRSPSRTSLEEALLPRRKDEVSAEPQDDVATEIPSRPAYNDEEEDELAAASHETPRRTGSKLPLPRNPQPAPEQSPLTMATIAAKLAASEREADAARVRAKLKAVRGTRGVKRPTPANDQPEPSSKSPRQEHTRDQEELPRRAKDHIDIDPVKRDPQQSQAEEPELKVEKRKRDRTSKVTSRRRSTLSPWELESLMSGNVQ